MSFPRKRESSTKYRVPPFTERYSRDRAHKMYFLCKANPIAKMKEEHKPLLQKGLRENGHPPAWKKQTQSKPNQTQFPGPAQTRSFSVLDIRISCFGFV
jgi:hypothetical protein